MRLVMFAWIAVALAGCGQQDAGKTTVSSSTNGYTVTTRDGDVVTTQVATPPGGPAAPAAPSPALSLPDFAPLYPGGVVRTSSLSTASNHQIGSVTYTTPATPKAVLDFYKPKAAAAGFAAGSEVNVGVGLMYAATDTARTRTLQVIATAETSGTAVVLTWTSPKS